MVLAAALTLQIAGFEALRRWKTGALYAWTGAGLCLGSFWLFARALGWELGLSWALVTISLIAYALLLWPLIRPTQIGRDRNQRETTSKDKASAVHMHMRVTLIERLVSAGPLYLVAALALGLVFGTKLPWQDVDRLMTGALLIPLFWSIGALHATADVTRLRILGAPILITLLSAGLYAVL